VRLLRLKTAGLMVTSSLRVRSLTSPLFLHRLKGRELADLLRGAKLLNSMHTFDLLWHHDRFGLKYTGVRRVPPPIIRAPGIACQSLGSDPSTLAPMAGV